MTISTPLFWVYMFWLFLGILQLVIIAIPEKQKGKMIITIYPPVEIHDGPVCIFDDPSYCDDGIERCPSLDKILWKCDLFTEAQLLLKNDMLRWFLKCQQCKYEHEKATLKVS